MLGAGARGIKSNLAWIHFLWIHPGKAAGFWQDGQDVERQKDLKKLTVLIFAPFRGYNISMFNVRISSATHHHIEQSGWLIDSSSWRLRAEGPSQYQPSPDAGAAQAEPAAGLGLGA